MIKINLLGVSKEAIKEMAGQQATVDVAQKVAGLERFRAPIIAAAVLVGVLVIGVQWYTLNAKSNQLAEEIRAEETRKRELEAIAKKVETFGKKKAELEKKYNILRNLREQQVTPVYIMDEVSSRLDDYVWLKDWDLSGNNLKMKGTAFTIISMTNFMGNLQASPYFADVALGTAKESKGYVDFDFTCTLKSLRPPPAGGGQPSGGEGGGQGAAKGDARP